jgi:hypothetical protein
MIRNTNDPQYFELSNIDFQLVKFAAIRHQDTSGEVCAHDLTFSMRRGIALRDVGQGGMGCSMNLRRGSVTGR